MNTGIQINWKPLPYTWITLLLAAIAFSFCNSIPESWGYENNVIENSQMVVLALGFIAALRAREEKQLFTFFALIIVVLMLREVNCGRTIFFAKPDTVNEFYKWKEIPYGWVARVLYGLYMAWCAWYFISRKLWKGLWNMLREVKLPVWHGVAAGIFIALGMYAEKNLSNLALEELAEMFFYVVLVTGIQIYACGLKKNRA